VRRLATLNIINVLALLSGGWAMVLSPTATEPNALIYLAFVRAVVPAAGPITPGVGLLRKPDMVRE
jgi:hypothetical protein